MRTLPSRWLWQALTTARTRGTLNKTCARHDQEPKKVPVGPVTSSPVRSTRAVSSGFKRLAAPYTRGEEVPIGFVPRVVGVSSKPEGEGHAALTRGARAAEGGLAHSTLAGRQLNAPRRRGRDGGGFWMAVL